MIQNHDVKGGFARRPLVSMGPGRGGHPMAVHISSYLSWSQIVHGRSVLFYHRFDRYEPADPLDAFCAWLQDNDVVYRYDYDGADSICIILTVIPERVLPEFQLKWGYLLEREYPKHNPEKLDKAPLAL